MRVCCVRNAAVLARRAKRIVSSARRDGSAGVELDARRALPRPYGPRRARPGSASRWTTAVISVSASRESSAVLRPSAAVFGAGDRIVAIDGASVTGASPTFRARWRRTKSGDAVTLGLERTGTLSAYR